VRLPEPEKPKVSNRRGLHETKVAASARIQDLRDLWFCDLTPFVNQRTLVMAGLVPAIHANTSRLRLALNSGDGVSETTIL